ncbi:MAG: histidine phosphatase family protein [Magnetococcales bacterium]|nr:histidine phosphatase family protein [Magnetococcales bacterium]
MSYQLLLMRHAKSAWDTDAKTDFERPLADRGQKDAPRVGEWLKKEKLIPEYVVSSSAERTRQTATIVCDVLDIKHKKINWDARIYGAGTEELLEVLADVPAKVKSVLLVGHNPGLEFLFSHLVGSTKHGNFDVGLIKTATVVHLKVPEDWSALSSGCATLVTVKHPRDLS